MQATRRSRASGVTLEEVPAEEPMPISIGELVAGKYRVTRILGVGGMGVVAAADHEELGERVALKIMRTERKTEETVERFLREARAAVRLKSSHVAKVRDVGTLPNGLPYMVMDLLDGSDLYTVVQERGPLPLSEAVDYILQACDAIAEAHALGIVHRDIKPENLFLTAKRDGSPHVRVLDFGISKMGPAPGQDAAAEGATKRSVTHETAIIGSPSYMSPEQIRSAKTVDARTDIWALGCTLFELLTGQEAFGADNAPDIFVKVLEKPPPPLCAMRPELPRGIEEVVNRCLEKNREVRYDSIDAFANALMAFSPKRSTSMPPSWRDYIQVDIDFDALKPALVPAGAETQELAAPASAPRRKTAARTVVIKGRAKSRRQRNVVIVLAALAFVGAGGAVAWAVVSGRILAKTAPAAETAQPIARAPEVLPSSAPSAPSAPSASAPDPALVDSAPAAATPATSASTAATTPTTPKTLPTKGGKRPLRPRGGGGAAPSPPPADTSPTQHHRTDW